jgi:hypothetical protein
MTSGNAYPNQPEPDTSRERIELETRVLAAALRQSLERGDTAGSSHAHQQIFILLKTSQEMGWEEPISLPPELMLEKEPRRPMPDIDWGAPDESPIISQQPESPAETVAEVPAEERVEALAKPGADHEAAVLASEALTDRPVAETMAEPVSEPVSVPAAEPEAQPVAPTESTPSAPAAESVAARSTAPLVTVPTFALIPVPSFTASAPATGAAAILDFYLRLQVSQKADFGSIHRSFLRKVRPLLRQHASGTLVGQARKDLLRSLQSLWIAHDVLCDPVTRTDYDFRRMGFRGGSEEGGEGKGSVANRPQLRIGELLLCAGLLETTELEIAADMHKAMPEMMFGAFLVKQGFIEEDDLNCVLLGQQLLKTGGITAAQFQESMLERAKNGREFGDILVASRYLTAGQLQEAYRSQMVDTLRRFPVVVATVSLEDSAAEVAEVLNASAGESESETELASETVCAGAEAVATRAEEFSSAPSPSPAPELLNSSPSPISSPASSPASVPVPAPAPTPTVSSSPALNIGNAVPSWKDQLDWDSPTESENLSSSLVDTSPDLEVVTMPAQLNLAPSLASLYDTSDSRSDTAELPPSSSASSPSAPPSPFARPKAAKKKSLTDLMAELEPARSPVQDEMPEQSPFASIWADNSADAAHDLPLDIVPSASSISSFSSAADASSAANTVQRFSAQDDFAPPSLEHDEDLSQVEEEFAALNAAADEALDISEQEEMTATSELSALPSSEQNASQPVSPSEHKGSGSSWQIVSVPASALASLLLEDEPEAGEGKAKTTPGGPIRERRQLKTSFASDKPFTTKSNLGDNKLPPDGDRRSKRRKSK